MRGCSGELCAEQCNDAWEDQYPSRKMFTLRDTTIIILLESAASTPEASGMGIPVIGSMVKPLEAEPEGAKRCRCRQDNCAVHSFASKWIQTIDPGRKFDGVADDVVR